MIGTVIKTFSANQLGTFEKFAAKIKGFGAGFLVFDATCQCLLNVQTNGSQTDFTELAEYACAAFGRQPNQIQKFGQFDQVIALVLASKEEALGVALIDAGALNIGDNEGLRKLCDEHSIDHTFVEKALKRHSSRETDYLCEMLVSFAESFENSLKFQQQLEEVSTELGQAYEELMILYNMSTNMKVTQSNATYLQMACDQITQLINVEGIAIFLEKDLEGGKRFVLTAGSGRIAVDSTVADILLLRLTEELNSGKEALLDSNVDSPLKYEWPDKIQNIIAVPLHSNDRIIGLMIATNIIDNPDFDSTDVKLFNSVANQCAVFIENERLFGDLKELFIGSLKALTNSIDAKDQYTRGHSDRVAFISRWIADRLSEQQPIEEEQIHTIYLAGLLHDIGKIGIDEFVLRKKEDLTQEDIKHIKSHPRIGASILADIKQMNDIVPGVLYHHERVDGRGYPDGLTGARIPLIGKIVGLADAFDAMTSKRVYREAMSIKRALAEIENGIGTQFDEKIANVFLNSDIRKLWNIIQDGFIESWDYSNFAEYGATAVGTLIK